MKILSHLTSEYSFFHFPPERVRLPLPDQYIPSIKLSAPCFQNGSNKSELWLCFQQASEIQNPIVRPITVLFLSKYRKGIKRDYAKTAQQSSSGSITENFLHFIFPEKIFLMGVGVYVQHPAFSQQGCLEVYLPARPHTPTNDSCHHRMENESKTNEEDFSTSNTRKNPGGIKETDSKNRLSEWPEK